jgi:hypothetical protein
MQRGPSTLQIFRSSLATQLVTSLQLPCTARERLSHMMACVPNARRLQIPAPPRLSSSSFLTLPPEPAEHITASQSHQQILARRVASGFLCIFHREPRSSIEENEDRPERLPKVSYMQRACEASFPFRTAYRLRSFSILAGPSSQSIPASPCWTIASRL